MFTSIVPISHISQDSLTVRSFTLQLLVVNWHPTIVNIASGHVLGRMLLPADKQFQGVTISSPQLMLTSVLPLRVSTTSEWSEAISSITICCYRERGCKYLGHRRLNMSMASLQGHGRLTRPMAYLLGHSGLIKPRAGGLGVG